METNSLIEAKLPVWTRTTALLTHDKEAFMTRDFIWKLPNETSLDYNIRKRIFADSFVNPSAELVTAPSDVLFRQAVDEQVEPKSMLGKFASNVTRGGQDVSMIEFLRSRVGLDLRAYGNCVVVVDKPDTETLTVKEEKAGGMPYVTTVMPENIVDWEYDDKGILAWFAYRRVWCPSRPGPFSGVAGGEKQTVIWTRTEMIVLGDNGKVNNELSLVHNWNIVPVHWQTTFLPISGSQVGEAAFDISGSYIISANNIRNVALNELRKNGGSILLMHDDAVQAENTVVGDDGEVIGKRQDGGNRLVWGGDNIPEYLQKDLAGVELSTKLGDDYLRAAAENERDLKSVQAYSSKFTSGETVAQSGIAKAMDRDPIVSNLISLSQDVEDVATGISHIVNTILKRNDEYKIEFDREFDIKPASQKLENWGQARANGLQKISPTAYKILIKDYTSTLTQHQEEIDAINSEIDGADVGADDQIFTEDIVQQ